MNVKATNKVETNRYELELEVSPEEGLIKNLTTGAVIKVPPLSPVMQNLIDKGGLVNYVREQLAEKK